MSIKYSVLAFCIMLVCLGCLTNDVFALFVSIWTVAPPSYVMLALSLIALITGVIGFGEASGWITAIRSWFTVLMSLGLSFVFLIVVLFVSFAPANRLLQSTTSPNHQYHIDLYLTDGGAMTSFGIRGVLVGPLWFKRIVYRDYRIDYANVKWITNSTISINGHVLNLQRGQTYDFAHDPNWKG